MKSSRGGMLVVVIAAVAAAPAAICTPGAVAAGVVLPSCPAKSEVVDTTAPKYVRAGGVVTVTIERTKPIVSEFAIETTNGPLAGQTQVRRLPFPAANTARVSFVVPPRRKSVYVRVFWTQSANTPAACTGQDLFAVIPVVAVKAKVGDPDTARITGRWTVRYSDRPQDPLSDWRLTPRCDVFGCRTALKSTRGLRGLLRPTPSHGYSVKTHRVWGTCTITRKVQVKKKKKTTTTRTVLVAAHTTYADVSVFLRPVKRPLGPARRMTGSWVRRYSIPSDRAHRCRVPRTERSRLSLRRR